MPGLSKTLRLRAAFFRFDDALSAKGVPPLTDWWREGVGRWLDAYEKGHVLELWVCVGRGAAKSTCMYKLALFFSLFGDFVIPPGERHFAVVLSRLKEEASKGIVIIAAWCRLLSVKFTLANDIIEFKDIPRGVRVVAASVAGTSGWRAFFVGKDERSKWSMGGAEELDSDEVDTSAAAMTATHAYAPLVAVGSAWGDFGAFHHAIVTGTDTTKVVIGPTPTWVAAPHISEASTHTKERDARRWAREYACQFQAGLSRAFQPDLLARAFCRPPTGWTQCERVVLVDPSAGGSDSYAYTAVGWQIGPEGQKRLVFEGMDGIERAASKGITSNEVVDRIVKLAKTCGAKTVHADQFERYSLAGHFQNKKLGFRAHVWTAPMKERAVEHVRAWMADDIIVLPDHPQLRSELNNFEEKVAPSGALTFKGRKGGHDDFAMLVLLAANVDIERGLPGSPIFRAAADTLNIGEVGVRANTDSMTVLSDYVLDMGGMSLD